MIDGVMCSIMERNDTPSVLTNWLRSRCVVIGVKRLKVLATCRELWVSGKPSNQSARGVDIPPTTRIWFSCYSLRRVGIHVAGQLGVRSCSRTIDVRPAHWMCVWSCSRSWCIWSTIRNERQTVASERSLDVPSVWVRFTLARLKLDSESSVSRENWDCLIPLSHRVTRATIW
jgi:hypothetical protein